VEQNEKRALMEALIFTSEVPLSTKQICRALKSDTAEVKKLIEELKQSYQEHHGLTVIEIAGGYRITCAPEFGERIRKLFGRTRQFRLTGPSLETLAIIAYKQPLTKAEIEQIRGVATDGVVRTLLERNFIKIVGRKEELGRPFLFGTTRIFLEHFGLKGLKDLPDASELEKMVGTIEEKEEQRLVESDPNLGRPQLLIADDELTGQWAAESAPVGESAPADITDEATVSEIGLVVSAPDFALEGESAPADLTDEPEPIGDILEPCESAPADLEVDDEPEVEPEPGLTVEPIADLPATSTAASAPVDVPAAD